MKNRTKKQRMLELLANRSEDGFWELLRAVEGDIKSLEGIPMGRGISVISIAEKVMNGAYSSAEGIEALREYIKLVPNGTTADSSH